VNRRSAVVLAFAVILIAAGAVYLVRSRALTPGEQLKRLPTAGAVIVYVDFDQLRRGRILDALDTSKAVEDDEYRKFAQTIHLDWRRDLDSAMVAFAPSGKYMLVKGRFDWSSLKAYAKQSGGDCEDDTCRMTGSTPERRISFFPVRHNLMALAVSTDDLAAKRMIGETPGAALTSPTPPSGSAFPAPSSRPVRAFPTAPACSPAPSATRIS